MKINERPIVVSSMMVRALLNGRKTQARRVIHPQPANGCYYEINAAQTAALHLAIGPTDNPNRYVPPTPKSKSHLLPCPYGRPGDQLWVKESWAINSLDYDIQPPLDGRPSFQKRTCWYLATEPDVEGYGGENPWSPAISMPRWASRLTLEILSVGVQKLRDIGEKDAVEEGAAEVIEQRERFGFPSPNIDDGWLSPSVEAFAQMWDMNHWGKTGQRWRENPYVWTIRFRTVAKLLTNETQVSL